MELYKENANNEILDDLAGRNLNWTALEELGGLLDQGVKTTDSPSFQSVRIRHPVSWAQLGNSFPTLGSGSNRHSVTSLSQDTIAHIRFGELELRALEWDGTDWSQKGNALSVGDSGFSEICALTGSTIALIHDPSDQLRTYGFDGTDWVQVGNSLSVVHDPEVAITALTSTTIALCIRDQGLRTYSFDGTNWSQVGNTLFSFTGAIHQSICALSSSTLAYIDNTAEQLRTYSFDGTNWAQVGSGLSVPGIGQRTALCALTSNMVAFFDGDVRQLRTFLWNNSSWAQVGPGFNIAEALWGAAICSLSPSTIAFAGVAQLRVYQLTFDTTPPNPAFGTL